MGSEILDSSGHLDVTQPASSAPSPSVALGELPQIDDLGEVGDVDDLGRPGAGRGAGRTEPVTTAGPSYLQSLRRDPGRATRALRIVAATVVLMFLTGWAVHAHEADVRATEASRQLAVDVRITRAVAADVVAGSQADEQRGLATIDLVVHNLGPRPVTMGGLSYGGGSQSFGPLSKATFDVDSGVLITRVLTVDLPCPRDGALTGAGSYVSAAVTTADGTSHPVRVDTSALDNQPAGLFLACIRTTAGVTETTDTTPEVDVRADISGGTDTITLRLGPDPTGGSAPAPRITIDPSNIPAGVELRTTPKLPVRLRYADSMSIAVTPVVHSCGMVIDYNAIFEIGLKVDRRPVTDGALGALVAQAIGDKCGRTAG